MKPNLEENIREPKVPAGRGGNSKHPEWVVGRVPIGFWNDGQNHKRYIAWFRKKKKIKKPTDWYGIRHRDFLDNHGYGFVNCYDNYIDAIKQNQPKFDWCEWLFPQVPTNFWYDPANRHRYMKWLGKRLGFRKTTDWYGLSQEQLRGNHAGMLLEILVSPMNFVTDYLPSHDWKPWLFNGVPYGFWEDVKNRRQYVRWLGEQLGIKNKTDWYQVGVRDFYNHRGGGTLIQRLGGHVIFAVKELFPKYDWLEWRFEQVPNGFWNQKKNRIRYLTWLGKQLNFRKPEDWYRLRVRDIEEHNGRTLLSGFYHDSFRSAVGELYPGQKWLEWKFDKVPNGFWKDRKNRCAYMRWLGEQLGFKTNEDWYGLKISHFRKHSGRGFFHEMKSPLNALNDFKPKVNWLPWRVNNVPHGYWKKRENRLTFMKWLGKQLGIKKKDEWYDVTAKVFRDHDGNGFLTYYGGSPSEAIMDCFPDYAWQRWRFSFARSAFWKKRDNRREYFHWLGKELGFRRSEDWNGLKREMLSKNYGSGLLVNYYKSSISKARIDAQKVTQGR